MSKPGIKAIAETNLPAVLALNQGAVPHVGSLTLNNLRTLIGQTCYARMVVVEQELAGFMLALAPGQPYQSPNYRWFCERYESFVYVDRIAVADAFHGRGIGKALYQDLQQAAGGAARITCEVNLVPPNPSSIAFHHKLGFVEVGQQDIDGRSKRVSLLCKDLSAVG